MKKLLLSVLLISFFASYSLAKNTVNLAIGDWAPYTSKNDPKGKLLEEVVTAAFAKVGVNVQYRYFPWKRSFISTQRGEYDGTFPWTKTKAREESFYIPKKSLIKDEGVYFHLKSTSFDWNTLNDLKKYRVGVTLGFKQVGIYQKAGINAQVVNSEELNFKKILKGRIDVYHAAKPVGYYIINNIFTPAEAAKFTNHPKPVEVSPYYIIFSRHSTNGKKFAEKFDIGFKKLKSSGRYKIIMDKYFGGGN